jgi:hypothetical protein
MKILIASNLAINLITAQRYQNERLIKLLIKLDTYNKLTHFSFFISITDPEKTQFT